MKLNTITFAIAHMAVAAIFWIVCSFFVGVVPDATTSFTKYALHADVSSLMRPFNVAGFIVGLLVLSFGLGAFGIDSGEHL